MALRLELPLDTVVSVTTNQLEGKIIVIIREAGPPILLTRTEPGSIKSSTSPSNSVSTASELTEQLSTLTQATIREKFGRTTNDSSTDGRGLDYINYTIKSQRALDKTIRKKLDPLPKL